MLIHHSPQEAIPLPRKEKTVNQENDTTFVYANVDKYSTTPSAENVTEARPGHTHQSESDRTDEPQQFPALSRSVAVPFPPPRTARCHV